MKIKDKPKQPRASSTPREPKPPKTSLTRKSPRPPSKLKHQKKENHKLNEIAPNHVTEFTPLLACRIRLGIEEKKSGGNEAKRGGGGFAGSGNLGVDGADGVRVRVRLCMMVVVGD